MPAVEASGQHLLLKNGRQHELLACDCQSMHRRSHLNSALQLALCNSACNLQADPQHPIAAQDGLKACSQG